MSTDPELAAIQEAAAAWFSRRLGDSPSGEEQGAFHDWLKADPRHRAEYEVLEALWAATAHVKPPRRRRRRGLGGAMTVLVAGWLWAWSTHFPKVPEIVTAAAQRQHLELEDGSRLDLAPNTRLRVVMDESRRQILLERGQIVVSVAKDRRRSFEVLSGGGRIRDIGTRFGVVTSSAGTRVTVAEGAVDISMPADARGVVRIEAGQTAEFGSAGVSRARPANVAVELGWTSGMLEFDAVPLGRVVEVLNRFRSVPVELADPALGAQRISGVFLLDEPDGILRAISQIAPVEFVDEGNRMLARHTASPVKR